MVKLQMRQLNVERQRLNVERQKLAALQGIEAHMKFIRCDIMAVRVAVCHSTGVEVLVSDNVVSDNKEE